MWLRSAAFVKVSHSRSLSLSRSLARPRGGRHFWPLCVAQIDQARPHSPSVGRSAQCRRRRPLRSFSAMLRREK